MVSGEGLPARYCLCPPMEGKAAQAQGVIHITAVPPAPVKYPAEHRRRFGTCRENYTNLVVHTELCNCPKHV